MTENTGASEGKSPESTTISKDFSNTIHVNEVAAATEGKIIEGKILSARGTEDGLVLRIDGKIEWQAILAEVESFLGGRRKFFEGGEIFIEWLERLPSLEQSNELEELLKTSYGIEIATKKRKHHSVPLVKSVEDDLLDSELNTKKAGVTINLFKEIASTLDPGLQSQVTQENSAQTISSMINANLENLKNDLLSDKMSKGSTDSFEGSFTKKYSSRAAKFLGEDVFYDDEANAKVHFGTLRSGQRLETPFSLIVIGDVNPGADLVAGGDIIVLGGLRGTAHASAYDDEAFDRVIIALNMQPVQLRIGSVISRGNDVVVKGVEIARIENRRIIVEAYNPRAVFGKRFR